MKLLRIVLLLLALNFVCMFVGVNIGRYVAKKYDEYKFMRVIDGDTELMKIYTQEEDRKVRILGIDAPELNECMGAEAKDFLGSIVNDKDMNVHKVGVDSFGRVVARITIGGEDIAPKILRSGFAKVDDASKDHIKADSKPTSEYLLVLRDAESVAKNEELGVWSKECVSKEPKRDLNCNIKGNYRDGKRVYYLPSCSQYKNVVVEEQAGDSWFCTEKEAKTNGFVLAASCVK